MKLESICDQDKVTSSQAELVFEGFWGKIVSGVRDANKKIGLGLCGLAAFLGNSCSEFPVKDFPPPTDCYCESTLGCEEIDFSELSIEDVIDVIKCPNDAIFYKREHLSYNYEAYEEAREAGTLLVRVEEGDLGGGNIEEVHQSGKAICAEFTFIAMYSLYDNGFPPLYLSLVSKSHPFSDEEPLSHGAYVFNYISNEGEELYGVLGINDFEEYYGFVSLKDIAAFYALIYGINWVDFKVLEFVPGKDNKLYWKYLVSDFQYTDTSWNKTEEYDQMRLDDYFERLIPYDTCPLESELF